MSLWEIHFPWNQPVIAQRVLVKFNKEVNQMEHSKEWYVQKHREMWNWIADQIENEKRVSDIDALKSKWCSEHNISAYNDCLACEYNTEGYCRTGCLFTRGCLNE